MHLSVPEYTNNSVKAGNIFFFFLSWYVVSDTNWLLLKPKNLTLLLVTCINTCVHALNIYLFIIVNTKYLFLRSFILL